MKPLAALALAGGAAALAGGAAALAGGAAALAWFVLGRAPTPAAAPAAVTPTPTGPGRPGSRAPSSRASQPRFQKGKWVLPEYATPAAPAKPSDSDPRMVAALAAYEAEKRASTGYFFKSKPMWAWRGTAWTIVQAV